MIIEDYVSFETAKLLKEKGFDIPVRFEYHAGTKNPHFHRHLRDFNGPEYSNLRREWYSAPTLQMATKWLREMRNIVIEITSIWYKSFGYNYIARIIVEGESKKVLKHYNYYEEACEAGIKYCLENLI